MIVSDISGNVIGQYELQVGQEEHIIERGDMSAGIYFITIQSGSFVETQKLVFE